MLSSLLALGVGSSCRAIDVVLFTFGDSILGISSSGEASFFLSIMLRNSEEFRVNFLTVTFLGGSDGLVLLGIFALRISMPGIGPLTGVRVMESGKSISVENLLMGFT
jgi:hypothetical protein